MKHMFLRRAFPGRDGALLCKPNLVELHMELDINRHPVKQGQNWIKGYMLYHDIMFQRPSLDALVSCEGLPFAVLVLFLPSPCLNASSPSSRHSSTSFPPTPFSLQDNSNFRGICHSLRASASLPSLTSSRNRFGVAKTSAANSCVLFRRNSSSRCRPSSESGAGVVSRNASRMEEAWL